MHDKILHLLSSIEAKYNVRVLYACESGSRAWGFHSPDSDYDIRFIYQKDSANYLSLFDRADTIEIPIKDDLDPGGWDIKKSLSLLAKSNGALIEWLHSPIVYIDRDGFRDKWQTLSKEVLQTGRLRNHYLGMSHQVLKNQLETDTPTTKSYLYALRALLAAHWIEKYETAPPVPFTKLLEFTPPELRNAIEELLTKKSTSNEKDSLGKLPIIHDFITESLKNDSAWTPTHSTDITRIQTRLDKEFLTLIGRT